jgi:hypothetical protein
VFAVAVSVDPRGQTGDDRHNVIHQPIVPIAPEYGLDAALLVFQESANIPF